MIHTHHLSHTYSGASEPALVDLTLHIPAGETIGLLGANGAGKTTLMSLLAGLIPAQHGALTLRGTPYAQLTREQRQRFALVPQDFAFYPQLTVWDNLRYFAALYDLRDTAHLRQILTQCELDAHSHKRAAHLSGGQKRRLNFAIGLINRPDILFLDEITVGIDPPSRAFILDRVQTLGKQGVTILYTSHYLQEIEQLCRHLIVLERGRLRHQGRLHDILAQHPPSLALATEPPLSAHEQHTLHSQYGDDLPALLHALQQRGYRIRTCHFGAPSLERFYLDFLDK